MIDLTDKQTEFRSVYLGDVCDFQGGTQPPKTMFVEAPRSGYVRLLQIQDFRSDDFAIWVPDNTRLKKCNDDDVMIGRYGASVGKIFRGKSGAYNVALVKSIPCADLNKDYLFFLLQSVEFQQFLVKASPRAAQAGFNKSEIGAFKFKLPDPTTQANVVGRILERSNTAKQAYENVAAQIDALDKFIEGSIRDAVADSEETVLAGYLDEVTVGIGSDWATYPVLGATREGLAPAKDPVGKNPHRYKPVQPGTIFYNPMRILLGSIAMVDEGDASGITSPDYVVMRGIERQAACTLVLLLVSFQVWRRVYKVDVAWGCARTFAFQASGHRKGANSKLGETKRIRRENRRGPQPPKTTSRAACID